MAKHNVIDINKLGEATLEELKQFNALAKDADALYSQACAKVTAAEDAHCSNPSSGTQDALVAARKERDDLLRRFQGADRFDDDLFDRFHYHRNDLYHIDS